MVNGQESLSSGFDILLERGDNFYRDFEYKKALEQYLKAFNYDETSADIHLRIADCHYASNDFASAENYFSKYFELAPASDHKAEDIYKYVQVLKNLKRYDEAKLWLNRYSTIVRDDKAKDEMVFLDNIKHYQKEVDKYELTNCKFNSPYSDYSPMFFKDEVVYVSNRNELTHEQAEFYQLYKSSTGAGKDAFNAELVFHHISKDHHDGPVAFSPDYKKVYVTRTLRDKRSNKEDKNKLKIFYADVDSSGEWTHLQDLNLVDPGMTAGHPTLSTDGNTMYFVSDMPGGYGATDIYKCTKVNGQWSSPVNLGDKINSAGNDMFPFLHNDTVLFFASSGHPGLGGLDIFKVDLDGPDEGTVVNMKSPVNTEFDDFGFTMHKSGTKGYLSSNRIGGKGSDDIYAFTINKVQKIIFEGFAKKGDVESYHVLDDILFYDNVTKERLGISDENGFFHMELENHIDYELAVKSLSYQSDFYIHFEGFVKNNKDTSDAIDLVILDRKSKLPLAQEEIDDYFTFNLEEGRDYEVQIHINEEGINLSDVHLEGFVTGHQEPLVNLGEVAIYSGTGGRLLFKSDKAGFFDYEITEDTNLYVRAIRRSKDDFYELTFEGFIKDHRDTSQNIMIHVVDPATGQELSLEKGANFTRFRLEKGKQYLFKATKGDGKEVSLEDIKLEGFVKDINSNRVVGDVKITDIATDQVIFGSDENGFFTFPMKSGESYGLSFQKPDEKPPVDVYVEGFFEGEDSDDANVSLQIHGPNKGYAGDDGFVGFNFVEGEVYKVRADIDSVKKKKFSFEGFVMNPDMPFPQGKINIYNAETNDLLFQTDDAGFFEYLMDEGMSYPIIAKREGGGTEPIRIKFDGVVRDSEDELHRANLILIDPNTGENLVEQDIDGFFQYVIEEGKRYDVKAVSVEEGNVPQDVEDIVVQDPVVDEKSITEHKPDDPVNDDSPVVDTTTPKTIEDQVVDVVNLELYQELEVYYNYDASVITDEYKKVLNERIDYSKNAQIEKVEVTSYADSRGSYSYNRELCVHRNTVLITYLLRKGVKHNLIKAIVGGEFPMTCNPCKESDYDQQRKTIIKIYYQSK